MDIKKFKINSVEQSKIYLLASIFIYLYRINNYENFTIFYCNSQLFRDAAHCAELFSNLLPMSANEFQSDLKVQGLIDLIKHKLELVTKQDTFLSDIFLRQPSLKAIADEAKEYFITFDLDSENIDLPQNSLIHFDINSTKGELSIYHRINCQYQGGTIQPVIDNLPFHLSNILAVIVEAPETLIHQFSFLSKEEESKLLSWSIGDYRPLPAKTITDLFEQQVKYSPESIALYEGNRKLSYHQLWITAEKICSFIQSLNLTAQSVIMISACSGADVLALMLGIFKSGCIALPMDTNSTFEVEEKFNLSLVLTTESYFAIFSKLGKPLYDIEELLSEPSLQNQNLPPNQNNLISPKTKLFDS